MKNIRLVLENVLSWSCHGLQKLLDICGNYGIDWGIKFNPNKSVACTFGGRSPSTGNVPVSYTHLTLPTNREV